MKINNRSIQAVWFDLDNTLYDFDAGHAKAMASVYDYFDYHWGMSPDEYWALRRKVQDKLVTMVGRDKAASHSRILRFELMMESMGEHPMPHALRLHHRYWDTLIATALPEPGILNLLSAIKGQNIIIGVGTNMTAHIQYQKLAVLDMDEYINYVVTSEGAGVDKPDKAFFEYCAEKANVKPENCLFVGDSIQHDIIGAAGVGMTPVWYHPEKYVVEGEDPKLPEGTITIAHFDELTTMLA